MRWLALLFLPGVLFGDCGVERWPVKVGSDPDAVLVNSLFAVPTTIEYLRSLAAPRPLPQSGRVSPTETTVFDVSARLVAFKAEDDGDYHLILADALGRTIIGEIPSVTCAGGSAFGALLTVARVSFDRRFAVTSSFQEVSVPVEIRGVGFFDFLHGQRGVAPNGIELHPVLDISFAPLTVAAPVARHRAIGGGTRTCDLPVLTMTTSKPSVCPGEPVLLSWQSSDPNARVAIDGIGGALASSGSTTVGATASIAYSGRATNACGTGAEGVAVLDVHPGATATLASSTSSLNVNGSATLTATAANATSWTITSSLGNFLVPSSGTTTGSFTISYTAFSSGTDTVTLSVNGSCGAVQRTTTIAVTSPTPQPPPPSGFLRCCDGTLSPTCTSCANKQGCCSHHGGVCGCQ